ncbi:membrane protein [Geomonas sp. Red276]
MQAVPVIYRLAISLWLGGAALFTFVLTPLLFKNETRDTAARIVGLFFPGYFRWGVACGVIALACRLVMAGKGMAVPTVILAVMLTLCSIQAFYIEPKAAELKRQIVSFETTPKDHPLRRQFSKLHGVSAVCNLSVIAGGVALVIML